MKPKTFEEACSLVAADLEETNELLKQLAQERAPTPDKPVPQRGIIERVSAGMAHAQFAGAVTTYTRRG